MGRNWVIGSGWAIFGIRTKFVIPPARRDHVLGEDILNDLNNAWAQTCPMRLEKERMISIRPRGLRRGEPPEGLENFFRRRGSS